MNPLHPIHLTNRWPEILSVVAILLLGALGILSPLYLASVLISGVVISLAIRSPRAIWILLLMNTLFISNYSAMQLKSISFWILIVLFIISTLSRHFNLKALKRSDDHRFLIALLAWWIWGLTSAGFSPGPLSSLKEVIRYGFLPVMFVTYRLWLQNEQRLITVLRVLWPTLIVYGLLLIVRTLVPHPLIPTLLGTSWHTLAESGSYYAVFTPIFLSLFNHMRGLPWLNAMGIALYFAIPLASGSATAAVSTLSGVLVVVALRLPHAMRRIAVLAICPLVAIFIFIAITIKPVNQALVYELSGRNLVWGAAVRATLTHPITGLGPGQWSSWFQTQYHSVDMLLYDPDENIFLLEPSQLGGEAHNLFLTKAAEMGIPSAILLILLFGLWIQKALSVLKNPPTGRQKNLIEGALASFIGLTVFCLFENGPIIGSARDGELLFVMLIMVIPFAVSSWTQNDLEVSRP